MFTWTIGGLGTALSFWIGSAAFGFSPAQIGLMVLASNVAGFFGGLLTLQAERVSWIKKYLIPDWVRTWALLVFLFFGIQLGIAESLRSLEVCLGMAFPLILSTGLMLASIFGPSQDFLLRLRRS